jgi:hypothetical protein
MSWDIAPEREQEYFEFVVREFIPGVQRLGFELSDAWATVYGSQPQILVGAVVPSPAQARQILKSAITGTKSSKPAADSSSDLAARLLDWYRQNRRSLPWRTTSDPYAVWVAEIMLQQTRVETVIPYYQRWMERFPTLQHLAQADEQQVLKAWEGLGYYSRARCRLRARNWPLHGRRHRFDCLRAG